MHCCKASSSAFCPEKEIILIRKSALMTVLAVTVAANVARSQMNPTTSVSFNSYVAQVEKQIRNDEASPESFLGAHFSSRDSNFDLRLQREGMLIEKSGVSPTEIPSGLIHHWVGATFIADATTEEVFAVVRDYGRLERYYSPEVLSSRLISRNGDDFQISLRLRKHKVVTVVLDTEYDVHYGRLDPTHQFSFSRSTRVSEIVNPGERTERPLAEGNDHGYMRRLNTYWRFVQMSDGVVVECEAISMTREVPTGLGWLIEPFIQNLPRESLEFTLIATREAVLKSKKLNQVPITQPRTQ
jgi:hypothetical protein